jgi:hypothetical protein
VWLPEQTGELRNHHANWRIEMTDNAITPTRRAAAGAVARHDCADHGCLAAMLGLSDAGDAEEDSS